jgi:hypothetical protein
MAVAVDVRFARSESAVLGAAEETAGRWENVGGQMGIVARRCFRREDVGAVGTVQGGPERETVHESVEPGGHWAMAEFAARELAGRD